MSFRDVLQHGFELGEFYNQRINSHQGSDILNRIGVSYNMLERGHYFNSPNPSVARKSKFHGYCFTQLHLSFDNRILSQPYRSSSPSLSSTTRLVEALPWNRPHTFKPRVHSIPWLTFRPTFYELHPPPLTCNNSSNTGINSAPFPPTQGSSNVSAGTEYASVRASGRSSSRISETGVMAQELQNGLWMILQSW
jgi:hypothetical protein